MSEAIISKTLTIDEWHHLAQSGRPLPMRIPINGVSMFPLVRRNRDMVTIMPISGPLTVGDIVVFHDPTGKRYVLHRVIELSGDTVLTRGDNCVTPDRRMPLSDVWGKAVLIERGKRLLRPDPVKGLKHAKAWYKLGPVHRLGMRYLSAIARRVKRLFSHE